MGPRLPRMVDISGKTPTGREARAAARLKCPREVVERLRRGDLEKGDALAAARLAGIAAAKRTHELIPLCHPIPVDFANVELELGDDEVRIETHVKSHAATGVEMEALAAAAMAALTIYDMCKALSPDMIVTDIRLVEKTGGKQDFRREAEA